MQRLCVVYIVAILLLNTIFLNAQSIFFEDFEQSSLPVGWTQQSSATDGGWRIDKAPNLSSTFWTIADNGSRIAATNDDNCNCDKRMDYLISPTIDLSSVSAAVMEVDILFEAKEYQNVTEEGAIEVSTDGGATWTVLKQIKGEEFWQSYIVDLGSYVGQSVLVAFRYNDQGGWLYGMAIDNVSIFEPIIIDAAMTDIDIPFFGIVNQPVTIKGEVTNNGGTPIQSLEVSYQTQEQLPEVSQFDNLNITTLQKFRFTHQENWMPAGAGRFDIRLGISSLNRGNDFVPINDFLVKEIEIFDAVTVPNIVNNFVNVPVYISTIANNSHQLDRPTDLDFFPALSKNELWVVNEKNEAIGGNAVIISNAGKSNQGSSLFEDSNSYMSMSLPTSIAFGGNGNFATGSGIQDANHNGGIYSGPTLWTGNPDEYIQNNPTGSHIDMLHSSPQSMGIAHERDNVYWVFDGYHGEIIRYDFQQTEGIGSDDFSDGIVRRYTEVKVEKDSDIPSHMVMDYENNWLYIADTGNKRILRLLTTSGEVVQDLPIIVEPLAEHSRVSGVIWETAIWAGLEQPSGIELIGNRLLVSDYATGDIVIYSTSNNFLELGRIETGKAGICGIKIGPEGNIWYTNRLENTVSKITSSITTSTQQLEDNDMKIQVYPNPSTGIVYVDLQEKNISNADITILDINGRVLKEQILYPKQNSLDLGNYPKGVYILKVQTIKHIFTHKLTIK